jgi:hypothetical protein
MKTFYIIFIDFFMIFDASEVLINFWKFDTVNWGGFAQGGVKLHRA